MHSFTHIFQKGASSLTILTLFDAHDNEDDEDIAFQLARELFPGANILSVRGRIADDGETRFFRRHNEAVLDADNLESEADALADFVAWASGEYDFDAAQIWALGYGDGAMLAASLFFVRPETLAGAVLLRAMTPLQSDLPDLSGKQIFLAAGGDDAIIPTKDVQNLEHHFKAAGGDVTLNLAEADHNLTRADIEAARDWLKTRA